MSSTKCNFATMSHVTETEMFLETFVLIQFLSGKWRENRENNCKCFMNMQWAFEVS